jgi:hypothetical protein
VPEAFDKACCNSQDFRNSSFSRRIHECFLQGFLPSLHLFVRYTPSHNPIVFSNDLFLCGHKQMGGEACIKQGIQRVTSRPLLALDTEMGPEQNPVELLGGTSPCIPVRKKEKH